MILIDGYEIDAALSESHNFESEVTEYPVEQGADVADHVRARPITVTIEGIVSDTPIGAIAARRGDTDERGRLVHLPSEDSFAWLMRIRDDREPVSIQTSLRGYDNMVLQSLNAPRDAKTGDSFRFTATFVQVQLITNERTTVRVSTPRAAGEIDLGNKPSQPIGTSFLGAAVPRTVPSVDTTRAPVRRIPSAVGGSGYAPSGYVLVATGGG